MNITGENKRGNFNFHIRTYGCSANAADSEKIKYQLQKSGGKMSALDDAEVVIINSCGVKGPTENKVMQKAENILANGFPLVIAGCLPRIAKKRITDSCGGFAAMIDTRSLHLVSETVLKVLEGERGMEVFSSGEDAAAKAAMKVPEPEGISGIVQVSEGCNGECTYCATKLARGNLHSFPSSTVISAVKLLVEDYGCREAWLTAQDTGSYCSNGLKLPGLLEEVLEATRGTSYSIRVGMMNPGSLKNILTDYAGLLAREERIYRFLHLPVQSGSDEVLKTMKRHYTTETVKEAITVMREEVERLTLATDIITGFPGETERDFNETMELISWLQPDVVNISRFWPRKGTKAAGMKRVPHEIVKGRTKRLVAKAREIAASRNAKWNGWTGQALVTEKGRGESSVLRNQHYKPVVVKGIHPLGKKLEVKITGHTAFYLTGEILETNT